MSTSTISHPVSPGSKARRRVHPVRSHARTIGCVALAVTGLAVLALLIWQAVTAHGNPNPAVPHLGKTTVIVDAGILVLREGLECILVLSALTASFVGANHALRRPVAVGSGAGFLATVATWFVAIAILGAVNAPALDVQAVTGLLAIAVLLVVMNWFFHKVYWTGWISAHNRKRRDLLALGTDARRRLYLGLGVLGLTAVYREGFEVVLFLQTLRLQAGSMVVFEGVSIGLALTAVVGVLTFVAHHRLPYKKMLILTGVMLGCVLVVMVGENVQELQQAGWMSATDIAVPIPGWMGLWFAVFPTVESLAAQALAALVVIGSYFVAEDMRVRRPRRVKAARAGRQTESASAPVSSDRA